MIITDQEGRTVEFFIDNYRYKNIATEDFSPLEDASMEEKEVNAYIHKGFLVMPHADGTFYGITWRDYKANGESLTGLTPEIYKGRDSFWIECRFVKVYAANNVPYANTTTSINVDIPL